MPKIKLLVDETITNVIEDGVDKGPKRCFAGEEVEVFEGVANLMISYGRAELVQPKKKAVKKGKRKK